MEVNAEALFDHLGKRYEDAYANSPNLCAFIQEASQTLPLNSTVLDVGCGTGRPVAHMLTAAGHAVHGIDVSQTMVDIASKQVPGTFTKADMRKYKPGLCFDGIFAIFSLFQITPGETCAICYKFAEWLKPGGRLVLGVAPSTSIPADSLNIHDQTWDCDRQMGKPWMGKCTSETFFSGDGWKMLLQNAGVVVEQEVCYTFTPEDEHHKTPEAHLLFSARKVEQQPLLGPYPIPGELDAQETATNWGYFPQRLESDDLAGLMSGFDNHRVLCLGNLGKYATVKTMEVFDGALERLSFPDESFDAVLVPWKLDTVDDLGASLKEIVRVTKKAPTSRVMFIQGAPANEFLQILKTTPGLFQPTHQGRLLRLAMRLLSEEGFGDVSLAQIDGKYVFPEEDVSERIQAASQLLAGGESLDGASELFDRLELHFKGSKHCIGAQMVVLTAKPTAR